TTRRSRTARRRKWPRTPEAPVRCQVEHYRWSQARNPTLTRCECLSLVPAAQRRDQHEHHTWHFVVVSGALGLQPDHRPVPLDAHAPTELWTSGTPAVCTPSPHPHQPPQVPVRPAQRGNGGTVDDCAERSRSHPICSPRISPPTSSSGTAGSATMARI